MNSYRVPMETVVWFGLMALFFLASRRRASHLFEPFYSPPALGEVLTNRDLRTLKAILVPLARILGAYIVVTIMFMLSGVPVSTLVIKGIEIPQKEVIELSVITFMMVGIMAAVFTRIFALYHSQSIVKVFYFHTICTISALFLFYFPLELSPGLKDIFGPIWDTFSDLYFAGFFKDWICLVVAIVLFNEAVILLPSGDVPISLFRERRELVDEVPLFLLRSEILNTAISLITKETEEVIWTTWRGDHRVAEHIIAWKTHRKENRLPYTLQILTTQKVYDDWEKTALLAPLKDHMRKSIVGSLRFVIVDKTIALEAIPMPLKEVNGANVAIKTTEISRVKQLLGIFNQWWGDGGTFDSQNPD